MSSGMDTLPAELLTIIFIMVSDSLVDYGGAKAPPCTFLSYVCKRWRYTALACQELWSTYLPRKSVEWTETCLSRCPSRPLKVTINAKYGSAEAAALVMHHWPRIKVLSLRPALYPANTGLPRLAKDSEANLKTLFDFIVGPNEHLEELEIDFDLDVWIPVELPKTLFSSHRPPRLHRLRLTRCCLPVAPPLQLFAPSIRTLELTNTRAWPDIDSMVVYLRTMPMLEQFTYKYWQDNDIFDCRPSRTHQIRCVRLPWLTDLVLDGFWLQNVTIFNYISVPSRCCITVDYREWEQIDNVPEAVVLQLIAVHMEALRQHFTPATSRGAFYSLVKVTDFNVVAETGFMTQSEHTPNEVVLLPSEFRSYLPATTNDRIRQAAFRLYIAQPVMTRANRLFFNADAWRLCPEVYEEYNLVRELCFTECNDVEAFTTALRLRGASLFPSLRRVILIKLVGVRASPEFLYELLEALRDTHVAARNSFECLELEHCYNITEDTENGMRAVLGVDRVVRNQPLES